MMPAALWIVLVGLQLLLVTLIAARYERELDAEQAENADAPIECELRAAPVPPPRPLLIGALESIQATTPGFTPPRRSRTRIADAIGWLLLAAVIVTTLAAAGGHWS